MPTIKTKRKTETNPRAAGRRSTDAEVEERRCEVAKYHRQGYGVTAIATMLGFSIGQVSQDLKMVYQRYEERQANSRKQLVEEQIEKLCDVRREAWSAYYKSMEDTNKVVEEEGIPKRSDDGTMESSMELIRRIKTREGRLPANCYLSTILETFKAERELLGLDEPVDAAPTNVHVFDWRTFAQKPAEVDSVEAKIKMLEDGTSQPQSSSADTKQGSSSAP